MILHRSLKLTDLHREHPVVEAAHMMVEAHRLHETMVAALDDVQAEFPELEPEQIILLWIGVNAKDREDVRRRNGIDD